ncbi:polymer-forming cytoskeletal protein [halophilic archaeon]|nr:polymer-forming cytoskeletal protein [halophilic archaeon]
MRERSAAVLAVTVVVVAALAAVPATVAAQETRTGGTVVVERGETVDGDLTVTAGNLVVRGTVNGDVTALSGNVDVTGTVNGDLVAFAGNVRVSGDVAGSVNAASGTTILERGARVGAVESASGTVVLNGTVRRDAVVSAGSISLGPNASIGGDLRYNGELTRAEGAQVQGSIIQSDELRVGPAPVVPNWVGAVYGFLVNLLLGVVLLAVFPAFSESVAGRARATPLLAGGVGLALLILVPLLLVVFAITIVGIPLAVLGALLFAVVLWAAAVYGAYVVGAWLISLADERNRWLALLLGLLVVAVVTSIPIFGGLVQFFVLLLGLGALSLTLWARYRGRREEPTRPSQRGRGGDEEPTA